MKLLLSLDTGLITPFTDCGGQYGKADAMISFCFNQILWCFRLSFVPFNIMTEGNIMNLSFTRTALSVAVATSFVPPVWANASNLDQVIVSATRVEQAKSDYTGNITVITNEQLTEKAIQTLPEALDRIGGLPLWSYGGMGKSTSLYLRGHDSKRTLLLVDGVRFNDPTNLNGANWEHILVSDIERIEILPGAQAGIWGADAGAGVINVITKKAAEGTHGSISYMLGDLGQKHTKLNASYGQQKFDARISLQSLSEDGFSAITPITNGKPQNPLNYEKDGYRNNTANIKFGWNLAQKQRLEVGGTFVDANNRYDNGSIPNSPDVYGTFQQNIGYLSYGFDAAGWQTKMSTSTGNMLRKAFDIYGGRFDVDVNQNSLISSKSDSLGSWSLGAEQIAQNAKQMGTGSQSGRYEQMGYFINRVQKIHLPQAEYPTIANVSLRKDEHNRYDDYVSKTLGIKQPLNKDSYLAFNLGNRQRTPNLFERFGGGWTQASPNLKPETIQSSEITFGWKGYSVTRFEDRVDNLINYGSSSYINIAGISQLKGWEWKAEQAIAALGSELALIYTVLDAKDQAGIPLAKRPEASGSLSWSYLGLNKTMVGLQVQYVGNRFDSYDSLGQGDKASNTGNYWLWHANGSYQFTKEVRLFVKGINITDERIAQSTNFYNKSSDPAWNTDPATHYYAYSPRTLLAGVEYKF